MGNKNDTGGIMPSTRHIATEQPYPTAKFSFPQDAHLLVTTPSTIYAWDAAGLHAIFTSSRKGIVAAREAKDGSGVLAVADKHVVILHDTKRGQEQSWGLQGDEDEVRQLEYAQDAKWLFLSTSLTHDVHKYSTERSRLMTPTQSHPSAPVALAISPTGHYWMVSASDKPPVVHLQSLQRNTRPILIEPRASSAAVCAAAFHSERPNIFLLGFRDGTVAAYDATRVSRKNRGSFSNQETVNDGEISHFTNLHRTTSKTVTSGGIASKNASIAGAAFLQGYKSRAITVGSDGRCRLVDFADRGVILRSWHAKAPLTSVSVLSIRDTAFNTARSKRSTSDAESFKIGGPTSTNNLIAVSRTDGKVNIYDCVGLLLEQKTVNEAGEKILSAEWVKGPSPPPISARPSARDVSYGSPTLAASKVESSRQLGAATAVPIVQPKSRRRRRNTLGRPANLRQAVDIPAQLPSARSDRRFTVHPDEAETEEGTVKYTPAPDKGAVPPPSAGNFLDLFSPVKPAEPQNPIPPQKRLTSPRPRPRISSQTFSSPADDALGHSSSNALDFNIPGLSAPTTDHQKSALKSATTGSLRRASTQISPLNKRHISFKPVQRGSFEQDHARSTTSMPPNENAKLLADLRKMSNSLSTAQGSVLAPFASGKASTPATAEPAKPLPVAHDEQPAHAAKPNRHWFGHDKKKKRPRMGLGKQKYWHPGNVLERESTWPTDSMLEDSLDADDIWITDASEKEEDMNRRRRMAPLLDPPSGRQTSRSRVTSPGIISNTNAMPPPPATAKPDHISQHLDGSATENFETAQSHVSPDGTFSPGSEDIRQLFPRVSSLSPQRKKTFGRGTERLPRSPRVLQEIAGNSLARTKSEAKSPWSKAKAMKIQERTKGVHRRLDTATGPNLQCYNCAANSSRIPGLEDELARLKGEVLVLKAVMRRAGVPLPASMRAVR
ncbi:hypothetical protein EJ03DRAFT_19196 [Teratosphaeria nubilosa]|uniref:WD40 repeat-like protein n=1 Tax=Teratosphaeria nubilosa TaxID=161662 RepID=A0A6G1KV95_9PEZI|nr:hypothetical protein EJ03DRAFT_19196 [Teratosphaeria nubilosa]